MNYKRMKRAELIEELYKRDAKAQTPQKPGPDAREDRIRPESEAEKPGLPEGWDKPMPDEFFHQVLEHIEKEKEEPTITTTGDDRFEIDMKVWNEYCKTMEDVEQKENTATVENCTFNMTAFTEEFGGPSFLAIAEALNHMAKCFSNTEVVGVKIVKNEKDAV